MNTKTESLKRLYKDGKVTLLRLEVMLAESKLTQEEFDYITQTVKSPQK